MGCVLDGRNGHERIEVVARGATRIILSGYVERPWIPLLAHTVQPLAAPQGYLVVVVIGIHCQSQAGLPKIADTRDGAGCLAGLIERRQQHRDQHGDDPDHHEKLYERKRCRSVMSPDVHDNSWSDLQPPMAAGDVMRRHLRPLPNST